MAHVEAQNPEYWVPPSTFGSRLAQIRQAKGWNVKQAADHCGIADQSWHNWEDGRSPRDLQRVAQTIAKAVPCDYVWLLAGVESRPTRPEKSRKSLSVASSRSKPDRRYKTRGNPLLVGI